MKWWNVKHSFSMSDSNPTGQNEWVSRSPAATIPLPPSTVCNKKLLAHMFFLFNSRHRRPGPQRRKQHTELKWRAEGKACNDWRRWRHSTDQSQSQSEWVLVSLMDHMTGQDCEIDLFRLIRSDSLAPFSFSSSFSGGPKEASLRQIMSIKAESAEAQANESR